VVCVYTVDNQYTNKDYNFGYLENSVICFRDIPKVSWFVPWISRRVLHLQAWISRKVRLLPDEFVTYSDK